MNGPVEAIIPVEDIRALQVVFIPFHSHIPQAGIIDYGVKPVLAGAGILVDFQWKFQPDGCLALRMCLGRPQHALCLWRSCSLPRGEGRHPGSPFPVFLALALFAQRGASLQLALGFSFTSKEVILPRLVKAKKKLCFLIVIYAVCSRETVRPDLP